MMKRIVFGLFLAASLAVSGNSLAAEKWEMPRIGQMNVPQNMWIAPGEQLSIGYGDTKSPELYLARKGIPDANFYTITWETDSDFSYGRAISAVLGAQYLQRAGVSGYRDLSLEGQLDLIAETLNRDIIRDGAVFDGDVPLRKISDKKHPRYEGSFVLTRTEEGLVYRTAYYVTVQKDDIRISVGIFASDADNPDFTKALADMMKKRKFPSGMMFLKKAE